MAEGTMPGALVDTILDTKFPVQGSSQKKGAQGD